MWDNNKQWQRDYWFVVYLARFICAIALHLKLSPNVRRGLKLMNFANNHPEQFVNDKIPVMCGAMQVFTSIFGQLVNVTLLLAHRTVEECIILFITLAIVLELPQMYSAALTTGLQENTGTTVITQVCKHPVYKSNAGRHIKFSDRTWFHKLSRIVYKFFRLFYVSIFFYFQPFICIIEPFMSFYPF